MNTTTINEKALEAQNELQNGCTPENCLQMWEIKAEFIPMIEKLRADIWAFIADEAAFENYCYKKIEQSVRYYAAGFDFTKFCNRELYKALKHFKKNRGRKAVVLSRDSEHEIRTNTGDGSFLGDSKQEWETQATGYTVHNERDAIHNAAFGDETVDELLATYANGDKRRSFILRVWAEEGKISDTEMAERLAEVFGGKWDTQRTFLKRFREQLRESLAGRA